MLPPTVMPTVQFGQNLLVNGDFEAGNAGFTSEYRFAKLDSGLLTYDIFSNPSRSHFLGVSFGDHTSGFGLMFGANGGNDTNRVLWRQVVGVVTNKAYLFSGWATPCVGPSDPDPSRIKVRINGSPISPAFQLSNPPGQWQHFSMTWNSGSSTMAGIELRVETTKEGGNDPALDDLRFELAGPQILVQPRAVEVTPGESATLSVQANGKGTLRYQWRFNGARIVGAVSVDLVLANITAQDEGRYTVEVTDDTGTVVSNPALLTLFRDTDGDGLGDSFERGVGRYQIIHGQFTWQQAREDAERRGGHLATITSEAEWQSIRSLLEADFSGVVRVWLGATDAVREGEWKWVTGEDWSYTRWYSGSSEPNGGITENFLDWLASDTDYRWNDESMNARFQDFAYLLEVGYYTDPSKSDSDGDGFSDGIEYEAGSIPTSAKSRPLPVISAQPQATNIVVGSSFMLTIGAKGYGPLAYQWRKDGVAIPNSTSATLTITNAQHAHSGRYDVVLSNEAGSVTSSLALVRIMPVLGVERLENGFVLLRLIDTRPLTWRVEASETLLQWGTLGSMTYSEGLGVFLDATAVGRPRRFYRVVGP